MKTYVDGLDGNNELKPFFLVLNQMRTVQNAIDKELGIDFDRVDAETKAMEEEEALQELNEDEHEQTNN